jgi:hypothetical protein
LFIVPARKYTLSELLHLDVCLPALFMPSRMGTVYSPKASLYFHPSGNMVSNDGLSAHSDRKLHVVHVRVYFRFYSNSLFLASLLQIFMVW